MKLTLKLFFALFLALQGSLLKGQSGIGLEGIDVETYYISTLQDQTDYGIPVGSRTHRVYVNMLPGYSLQAVFGSPSTNPDVDSLVIYSSAPFWNDAVNGANSANDIVNSLLTSGAAMIDSWFSFGSGGGTRKGTLKVNDTDGGLATLLVNTNAQMGAALTASDGRFNATPNALSTIFAGADLTLSPYNTFYNSSVSNRFSTGQATGGFAVYGDNGAATGSGTDNRVLIGQFTTTGNFGFVINLQLGTPTPGVSEVYVAQTPQSGEFTHPSLIRKPVNAFNESNITAIVTNSNNSNTTANVVELNKNLAGQLIPIQSIAIDSVRFSASATSTLYGSSNNDGSLFCFTGAKSTNITSNVNTLNPRVVVGVKNNGQVKIRTSYTGTSGQQTRGATSLDTITFFIADQAGQYTNGSAAASPTGNFRGIKAFGNIVYVGRSSSTSTISQVATSSAPSSSSITNLPGVPNNLSFQDFYLISSANNGIYDILYTLIATSNTVGSILKFSLVSGTWVANGSYTTTFGGFGLAAETAGSGGAFLYISTGQGALAANNLLKINDTAGYNATITINTASNIVLYTADPETIIKGIAFAPKSTNPKVNLSVSTNAASEANATVVTITATATAPVTGSQSVALSVSGTGINPSDYILSNTTININNGATTGSVTFTVVDDADVEGTETAMLTINSPSAGISLGTTVSQNIVITDNDFPPTPTVNLSVSTNSGSEASTSSITVTATASAPVVGNQTVSLGVSGTNITAGDYTLSNATITILNGQSVGTVNFGVVDDAIVEGNETAVLTISNPSAGIVFGATISQNISIIDNDFPIAILGVSASLGTESSSTKIDVTATSNVAVASNQTVALTVSGTNITSSDYYLSAATITIPAGQTSGTISFTIADDGMQELDETATLTISSPSSGIVLGSPTSQNILIKNNTCTFMRKISTITSANGSEIPAFDPLSKRVYVVAGSIVEFYDVSTTGILTFGGNIAAGFTAPSNTTPVPNSVAINNGLLAVAYAVVNNSTAAQDTGRISLYTAATGAFIKAVKVGFGPDMVAFTPDGTKVVIANEGEPNSYNQGSSFDPEGSVSVIDISAGANNATVQQAGFTSYNGQEAVLRSQGIRIYGPGANASKDFEPEYVTFSSDGLTAYITLQENNAIAVLDIATATFTNLLPLGMKNHNLSGKGLDASDQDVAPNKINILNWPVFGMYQPDAIASYTIGGQTYLITANEGDSRAYTGYSEEIRVGAAGYVLDPTIFPNATTLKLNTNLGRLQLTNATGDTDGDGDFDRIDALGARSFSIWNTSGTLVYDSGDQLESITASKSPTLFNSDGTSASFDGRSDNKGPEPEGVALGYISGKPYAFIGLERTGDIMVFDVSNPASPIFIQYINTPEDLGVEGLIFVKAENSPTTRPLLITSSEVSKTTTIYEIGTSLVTNTADAGNGTLREIIGCAVDGGTILYDQPTTAATLLTNSLTIDKNLTIQGLSSTAKPQLTIDFTGLSNSSGIIINSNKTVILKDVDIIDTNNTNLPANSAIEINSGAVRVSGSTTITKIN
jgi:hypothetical protein